MFRGFMDHWAPSRDKISTFWRSDFETCRGVIDALIDEIDFNNFTFYTKWYTNGIKSSLPFLHNHPNSSNTRTGNDWGRQIIDHLHSCGRTAGAMLQLYSYEQRPWGGAPFLADWGDGPIEGGETDDRVIIADYTADVFTDRMTDLIREQLTEFPGLDYVFFEYEGTDATMAAKAYDNYRIGRDLPPIEEASYPADAVEHAQRLGLQLDFRYSDQARAMFTNIMTRNLRIAQQVLDEVGSGAQPGVVYFAHEWERFFVPETLPNDSWWLLPWCYYGWGTPESRPASRQDLYKHIREQNALGRKSLYIGDATISSWDIESMAETMDFCESGETVGYLGMGNPTVDLGLRWLNVADEHVSAARDFFKLRWPQERGW